MNYPNSKDCVYFIHQIPGSTVILNFTNFDIEGGSIHQIPGSAVILNFRNFDIEEGGSTCDHDYVEVFSILEYISHF